VPEEDREETFEVGYREDGLMWVTAGRSSRTSEDAERCLGPSWQVLREGWLRPTVEEEWEECGPSDAGARRGWQLVDTSAAVVLDPWNDFVRKPNPHYAPPTPPSGLGEPLD